MARYLEAQAAAGAQALMLFDSWAGLLTPGRLPPLRPARRASDPRRLQPLDVPLIYFPNQGATLLGTVATLPADVVGVDWRMPLVARARSSARERPCRATSTRPRCSRRRKSSSAAVDEVLDAAGLSPGHIFNLGHGIDRTTDPDAVARLVDRVHERTRRS